MCIVDHSPPDLNVQNVVMLLLDRLHIASKVLQIVCQHLLSLTVGVTVLVFTKIEVIPERLKHLQLPHTDFAALATRRLIVRSGDLDLVRESSLGLNAVLAALLAAELAPVLKLDVLLLKEQATDPATVAVVLILLIVRAE